MRTEIPKVGVNHYLTDENRKWASPLIKMLAHGPLTVRVDKRHYAKQGSKSKKASRIEQRKEQYAAIRGDMMSGDYAVQCRGVRASISGKYLATKEWLNVLYIGQMHAQSRQIMPWDGFTKDDVRMLLRGDEGVQALTTETVLIFNEIRQLPRYKHLDIPNITNPARVLDMFDVISSWLRSGRRLMDVSIKSQETLDNLTEARWDALPLPGDELWKKGIFFRFEARPSIEDAQWNESKQPFERCDPVEYITYIESVGDVLDEQVRFVMWRRCISSPFTVEGKTPMSLGYSTEIVDQNVHLWMRRQYMRMAKLYNRSDVFGFHWGKKKDKASDLRMAATGHWSMVMRHGFNASGVAKWGHDKHNSLSWPFAPKATISRHNAAEWLNSYSDLDEQGPNDVRAEVLEHTRIASIPPRELLIASINLLAALNTKYTYQTVHRPAAKKSTSSSHSKSGPERIEISEDGLATWVHEVVRQGESSGVGSGKRWKQPAHVRCATTALVRVVAASLKPNEVIERTETKTLKSGKQRTYYWVRRVRKETIVEGELQGRRAHVVAGLDDEITT